MTELGHVRVKGKLLGTPSYRALFSLPRTVYENRFQWTTYAPLYRPEADRIYYLVLSPLWIIFAIVLALGIIGAVVALFSKAF